MRGDCEEAAEEEDTEAAREVECDECDRTFVSRKALLSHKQREHGRRRPARAVIWGSVCPSCGTDFHSLTRVMDHLTRGRLQCRLAFATGAVGAVSEEVQADVDAKLSCEIRDGRRLGRHPSTGPPYIPEQSVFQAPIVQLPGAVGVVPAILSPGAQGL